MHQVIFRSSIRRMWHVATNQKGLCSSYSSTTNNTTATRGTSKYNNSINNYSSIAENGNLAISVVSAAIETSSFKANIGSSFSACSGSDISIGSSTTVSKNTSKITRIASFHGKISYSNNAGSNSNDDGGSSGPEFRSVYVHPLSQILLEYLQDSHHEWIVAKGLDRSLTLHRDGSFELKHVLQSHATKSTPTATQPLSSTTHKKYQPKNNVGPLISASTSAIAEMKHKKSNKTKPTSTIKDTSDNDATVKDLSRSHQENKQHHATAASATDKNDNIRIWTSYDEQEKKHWLTVRRGLFRQSFLLQDNLLTAWQGNRGTSLPERLHVAVDEMVRAVDRLDQQQQQAAAIGQQEWQQKGQRRFRKR